MLVKSFHFFFPEVEGNAKKKTKKNYIQSVSKCTSPLTERVIPMQCPGSMNLDPYCPIPWWSLAVNRVCKEFGPLCDHSNKHRARLNRNSYACARRQIKRPVSIEAASSTAAALCFRCLPVMHQRPWPYKSHDNISVCTNLCCGREKNLLRQHLWKESQSLYHFWIIHYTILIIE